MAKLQIKTAVNPKLFLELRQKLVDTQIKQQKKINVKEKSAPKNSTKRLIHRLKNWINGHKDIDFIPSSDESTPFKQEPISLHKLKKTKQRTMLFFPSIGYAINKYRKKTRQLLTQFPTGTASILTTALRKDESTKKEYIDQVINNYVLQIEAYFNLGNNEAQKEFKTKINEFKTTLKKASNEQDLIKGLEDLVKSLEDRQFLRSCNKKIIQHIRMAILSLKHEIQALPTLADEEDALLKQLKCNVDKACLNLLQTSPESRNFKKELAQTLLLFQAELGELTCLEMQDKAPEGGLTEEILQIYRKSAFALDSSVTPFINRLLAVYKQEKTDRNIFHLLLRELHKVISNDVKKEYLAKRDSKEQTSSNWKKSTYKRTMSALNRAYYDSRGRRSSEPTTPRTPALLAHSPSPFSSAAPFLRDLKKI